jgi:hypothetical protein
MFRQALQNASAEDGMVAVSTSNSGLAALFGYIHWPL